MDAEERWVLLSWFALLSCHDCYRAPYICFQDTCQHVQDCQPTQCDRTCLLSRCAVCLLCHASAARVGFIMRKRRWAARRSPALPSSSAGSAAAVLENSCAASNDFRCTTTNKAYPRPMAQQVFWDRVMMNWTLFYIRQHQLLQLLFLLTQMVIRQTESHANSSETEYFKTNVLLAASNK